MRTDARPVIVFDLMAAKPVWHHFEPTCSIASHRIGLAHQHHVLRRDHAKKIGRQCDRCAKMEP